MLQYSNQALSDVSEESSFWQKIGNAWKSPKKTKSKKKKKTKKKTKKKQE